jgi:hypothetical protein
LHGLKILHLVSGPRNISTALMYSFAQRSDTRVIDEPFYALYLDKSGAQHPGRDQVLMSQSSDEKTVLRDILVQHSKPIVFIKNMAHHMEVMEHPFIENAIHIFLIRDPRQIIASYAQVIENPVMRDIGIEYQYQLFTALEKRDQEVIVLDSNHLLDNPEAVLKKLCHRCAIGFEASMLTWKAGPKPYDGVWHTHWYANVHRSTGFLKQSSSDRPLPDHLNPLYQQALSYYQKLLPISLKA